MLAGLPAAALLGAPLLAAAAEDVESSGAGAPTPTCMGEAATILGSPGNDRGKKRIVGTGDADVIVSFGGRDQIKGKGGPDLICSGPGPDVVRGGRGADEVKGGAGKDELRGNAQGDEIDGGRGGDRLNGGAGEDSCRGGKGKDKKRSCELSGKGSPKAKKDRASAEEGSTTTVDVLANDSDPKGRALKVVAVDDSGAAGSATLRRGKVEYEPGPAFEPLAAGQTGSDTFTYKIKNSKGKRDSAKVKVTIDGLDDPSKVTATPAIYPDFSPEISDYVTRCTGGPVKIDAVAGAGNAINVDGQGGKGGTSSAQVPLQENQRFSFVRRTGAGATTHHVRCLPADFPEWTFERFAAPKQQFYVVAVGDYVFALDGRGVPVWWFNDTGQPTDAKYLSDGTFTWGTARDSEQARYEVRNRNGEKLRDLKTVDAMTDGHDIQLLGNGNYLMMSYKERAGTVDLSQYPGGATDAKVVDAELQEITPAGAKVWEWNSKDHIGLDEIGHWWDDWVKGFLIDGAHDIVHINSAEMNGNSVLISLRHTDGVYEIDKSTGNVVWKLGGTPTPESLEVNGDPLGSHPLGGQHDARLLPGGTVTIFDNGAFVSDSDPVHRAPRGVRYAIDEGAGTATLLESVKDADVTGAICCGSARRSATGSWLIGWGGVFNPISEFTAAGVRTFKLDFPGTWSYRAHPVASGELSAAALRAGMDAQHPR